MKLRTWFAVTAMLLMTACASLPPQTGRVQTHALTDTANTRLGTAFAASEAAHPGDNAFHLLSDGTDALIARVILSETADRTLDLQYYIWHDDLGTNADDQILLALASHPNVQVRLFNPVANRTFKKLGSAAEFFRVNRRMHNKALIADNQAAILGGRNIGDEYFGASSTVAFGDLDVLVHGPIVRNVSTAFDEYWNSDASYPIENLLGRQADPSALAAGRAKLDAWLASNENGAYVRQAKARLTQVIQSRDAEFSWGKAT